MSQLRPLLSGSALSRIFFVLVIALIASLGGTAASRADANLSVGLSGTIVAGRAAGQDIAVTVTDGTASPMTAEAVLTPPDGVTYSADDLNGGNSCDATSTPGTVTCAVINVAANSSTTFHVTVHATSAANGSILGDASATDGQSNSYTADPTALPVMTSAVLSVTNSVADQGSVTSPDGVVAGNHVRYTIQVSNGGPSDAQAVTVSDPLPASLLSGAVFCSTTLATCDPTGGSSPDAGGQLGSSFMLQPTASKTFVVDALLRSSALPADGPLTNTAEATTTTVDPNTSQPGDVTYPADSAIDTRAALSIKNAVVDQGSVTSPDGVVAGNHVRYTIQVSNGGPSDAQAVTVSDPLPASLLSGAVFCSTTLATCDPTGGSSPDAGGQLGSSFMLQPTASKTFVVDALLRSSALPADGPLTNTAEATTTTVDPNTSQPGDVTASADSPIDTRADLQVISMTASTGLLNANSSASNTVTFTLKLTNAGPSDARSVTASLPEMVSPSTIPAFIADSGTSIGDVAAGSATTTVTIVAHANPLLGHAAGETPIVSGPLTATSTAQLSSLTQDQTPGNNVITNGLSPNVTINTVPSPVIAPAALPGSGNAVVTWNAPASNGGAPLDPANPYQIKVFDADSLTPAIPVQTIPVPTSAAQPCLSNVAGICFNVTGLTNGHHYTFDIQALNAIGFSDDATTSPPTVPTIDAAAQIIAVNTAATLTTCTTATSSQPMCVQYALPSGAGGVAGVKGNVLLANPNTFCASGCTGNAAFDLVSSGYNFNDINHPIMETILWDSSQGPNSTNSKIWYQSTNPAVHGGQPFQLPACTKKGSTASPDPCLKSIAVLGGKNTPPGANGDLKVQILLTSNVDGLTSKH